MKIMSNMNMDLDLLKSNISKAKKSTASACNDICESDAVNPTESEEVNDDVLASECEKIEKCAQSGESFHINAAWKPEHISELKEYAQIIGLKNENVVLANYKAKQVKLASVQETKETKDSENTIKEKSSPKWDAFQVQSKIDHYENVIKKSNWEQNKKANVLRDEPNILGGINSVRGGESTFVSNKPKLAQNQNSIVNPDAIKELLASKDQDTGIVLSKLNDEKQKAIQQSNKDWEQEKINAMKFANILPKGRVFATETYNANPGISNDYNCTAYSNKDFKDMPELTDGEKIKTANSDNLKSIKREKQDDSWEGVQTSSRYNFSDTFSEELRKNLKK